MRRALPLVAVLAAVGLLASGCGGGSDDNDEVAKGPRFLGVSVGSQILATPDAGEKEIQQMVRSGVTTVRVVFPWSQIEPARGRPVFAYMDPMVKLAASGGLEVLPVVVTTPAWAKKKPSDPAAPPKDPQDYARFLRALIGRYGPQGTFWKDNPDLPKVPIRAWQIWNEPSHDFYWSTQPWPASYVRLLKAAHSAIKSADPGGQTVLGGFPDRSWESLSAVLQAGGGSAFDVAAVHPYTAKVANVLKIVQLDRKALRDGGEGSKPLWLTEVAYSSGQGNVLPKYAFGFETTEQGQALKLGQVLRLLNANKRKLGIQRMYVETWASEDRNPQSTWDWAGIREIRGDDVREKPAFGAFQDFGSQFRDGGGG
jgi:hypothetical protein